MTETLESSRFLESQSKTFIKEEEAEANVCHQKRGGNRDRLIISIARTVANLRNKCCTIVNYEPTNVLTRLECDSRTFVRLATYVSNSLQIDRANLINVLR